MNLIRSFKRLFRILRADFQAFVAGNPQLKIKFIGVTGTSGKSTTSAMIYHILSSYGLKVGLISTVGAVAGEESIDTGFHVTTPDSGDLYKILKVMCKKKVEWVILETSSHALDQGRFGHLNFDIAVYTNIKRDHIDWHGSWENYAKAKFKLIRMLKSKGIAVYNKDDTESYNFIANNIKISNLKIKSEIYSKSKEISNIKPDKNSISFEYKKEKFDLNMIGEYNIDNWLAAMKVGELFKIPLSNLSNLSSKFSGVEGRMQVIQAAPFMAIVDFAHNTDSLEKSLISISHLKDEESKIIAIFGSAGLRDVEKRFDMGEVSGKYADITIVTAEDPRTESLYDINSKIIEGAESAGAILVRRFRNHEEYLAFRARFYEQSLPSKAIFAFDEPSINSRLDAIDFGILLADKGDVVITEGKGHEKSLAFNTSLGIVEYPFNDQDAVKASLAGR